ncbi:hypothetical protein JNJ66_02935 [Candidatus Saccharibacteria bacterium]|nr:hypothetical protein [Candidatus Saccharibacteria bacterium]
MDEYRPSTIELGSQAIAAIWYEILPADAPPILAPLRCKGPDEGFLLTADDVVFTSGTVVLNIQLPPDLDDMLCSRQLYPRINLVRPVAVCAVDDPSHYTHYFVVDLHIITNDDSNLPEVSAGLQPRPLLISKLNPGRLSDLSLFST